MQINSVRELAKCRRFMHDRILPLIERTVVRCEVGVFHNAGEPEPSGDFIRRANAGEVQFEPARFGETWGTTWGTTWFKVSGTVPAEVLASEEPLELVADLGWSDVFVGGQGEGLVYTPDATILKGLHPKNTWVRVRGEGARKDLISEDGSFLFYIEAAYNPQLDRLPALKTDLGYGPTGKADVHYPLRRLDLCIFDEEQWNYWLDLDVVCSLLEQLEADSMRYWRLMKAMQRSLNLYDSAHPETVVEAREALRQVLSKHAADSTLHEHAVGHAHIDSAWLWPKRETRRKVARTVSNALALMDQHPDYIFAMSSAQQYAWLEQDHPDVFARMLERIKEGRFVPAGGMWVESDGMMPWGESLIRQISFGRRYFREKLGVEPKGVWLPDSFGYNAAWPQIARRAGYEWFMTQKLVFNDTTKFPHHSFMWTGIDGTEIFTHFPPTDTYAAEMKIKELRYAERNMKDKELADQALLLYGYGDGGGGPTREMTAKIDRMHNLEGIPTVEYDTPDAFFDKARTEMLAEAGDEMPRWKGELYLELHRATLTSQQDMKRGCRREESLLRLCEYYATFAVLVNPAYRYPTAKLDTLWKTLLLNQFHDILPGSSISWVHKEAREDYRNAEQELVSLIQEACRALSAADPNADLLPQAKLSQTDYGPHGAWHAWSTVAVPETAGTKSVGVEATGDGYVLDNGLLRLTIETDGTISSLTDLVEKRELVADGERLGRYELLKNQPSRYDAWEIERDAFLSPKDGTSDARLTAETLPDGSARVTVEERLGEASQVTTTITLPVDAKRIEYTAHVNWLESERFLKVKYPLAINTHTATYECQYGTVDRPIEKNRGSDEAQYESCTHRFIHVEERDYGVGIANASTYGASVFPLEPEPRGGQSRGVSVGISLLSAPVYPDPDTDRGEHDFAWTIRVDACVDDMLHEAGVLNAPVIDGLAACEPLVGLDCMRGEAVIDWIKIADDGSGDVIVRLYEPVGARAQIRLCAGDPLRGATVRETDVLERDALSENLPRVLMQPGALDGAELSFAPYQIATLRITRGGEQ